MAIDNDLINRIHMFKVALDPMTTESGLFGHDSILRLQGYNAELAGTFMYGFGQRASELAVVVRLFVDVTADVPYRFETDIIERRTTKLPKPVELIRSVEGLRRSTPIDSEIGELVAVSKILAEKDYMVVGTTCRREGSGGIAILATSEETDAPFLAAIAETLEELLEIPRAE